VKYPFKGVQTGGQTWWTGDTAVPVPVWRLRGNCRA